MKIVKYLVLLTFTVVLAGPIEDLQPNCWAEIPNTHLQNCPERALQAQFPWLSHMFGAIMDVWCGGAFDTQRDWMLIGPGGGHASYNGNEVYNFDMNELAWHRVTDPDPIESGECTNDSVPFAMHTYDGGDYMPPPVDRYVLVGGWCTSKTYALDYATKHWENLAWCGLSRTGDQSAYNAASGLFYYIDGMSGRMASFNYRTDEWKILHSGAPSTYYATASLDFKRSLLISVGNGAVKVWDLTKNPVEYRTQATTGATSIVGTNNPGVEYDPVVDRIVCWHDGPSVYSLNTDTWVWTQHSPAAGNTVNPPAPLGNGTYGRFRYVPSKNVYILATSVNQNVFIYRLTAGAPNLPVRLDAALSSGTIETDLTYSVSGIAVYSDSSQRTVTDSLFLRSLTPATVAVTGGKTFKALAAGGATIVAGYTDRKLGRAVYDTLNFTVTAISGTVVLDSIVLSYQVAGVLAGESIALHATGYYTRASDHFTRNLDTDAAWSTSSPTNLTVDQGVVQGLAAGGPFDIAASLSGKSDTAKTTVYADPPVTRINFQVSATPFQAGWLADNGGAYNDTKGYGWTSGSGFGTRDDRLGTNFLLKSLVATNGECGYKVNLADGRYVLRLGLGDNQWGGSFTYIRKGTDTLCTFVSGANTITTNIVDVTGGNGLVLAVSGSINYLVVMADIGLDFDAAADDGYTGGTVIAESPVPDGNGAVLQAWPNPFNPAVKIAVSGQRIADSDIRIAIYDIKGKMVYKLSATSYQLSAGITWTAGRMPAGVYIAKLTLGRKSYSKRVTLLK